MRRSICYCEPSVAHAGEVSTWEVVYTTGTTLHAGAKLKFDIMSAGRDIDWGIPSVNIKNKSNIIYAYLKDGKPIAAEKVEVADSFVPQFEFTLPSDLKAGKTIKIVIGSPKGSSDKSKKPTGTVCQTTAQRRRAFLLYVDPTGEGDYKDPETFTIDIKGNVLENIRILTPSFVIRNKRFDVIARFEDEHGNLTSLAPEDTLIELTYKHIRENLNWKLFIPETGFITLPNLYFNEPGIYSIELRNLSTEESFFSPPIKCFAENNEEHLFWGLLHGESERVDSTENIENCLRHFRDEKAYNFYATSCFENLDETPNDIWRLISQNVAEFNEDDRFVNILGFQWRGDPGKEGIRNIIYSGDNKALLRKKETKNNTLRKIYKSFNPGDIISVPSFTMGKGHHYNFENYNSEFERVVEIYNAWGSSECTEKEGNPLAIGCEGRKGVKPAVDGSIEKALKNNCRFGFVAGGLDDRDLYGEFYDSDQYQYTPGLTAIIAKEYSRDSLMEALFNRSCYATTGEHIILGFTIVGAPMGSEINTKDKPGLAVNRHISGYVAGTETIRTIEIIRNGKVIETFEPDDTDEFEFTYDDMTPIEKVTIDGGRGKPDFAYYYVRVTQDDDHMAWSSPIWVDSQ